MISEASTLDEDAIENTNIPLLGQGSRLKWARLAAKLLLAGLTVIVLVCTLGSLADSEILGELAILLGPFCKYRKTTRAAAVFMMLGCGYFHLGLFTILGFCSEVLFAAAGEYSRPEELFATFSLTFVALVLCASISAKVLRWRDRHENLDDPIRRQMQEERQHQAQELQRFAARVELGLLA